MQLTDTEIDVLLRFVERQIEDVDESCSMLLGKGLDKSQDWDTKLKWQLDVDFAKLREMKAIIKKFRQAEYDELCKGE